MTQCDPINGCDVRPAWWHERRLSELETSTHWDRSVARQAVVAGTGRAPSLEVLFPPVSKKRELEWESSVERPGWWYEQTSRRMFLGDPTDALVPRPFDEQFPPARSQRRPPIRVVASIPRPAPRQTSWRKTPERAESFGDAHTYVIAAEGLGLVKIGITNNPESRRRELQTGQPMDLHLLWSVEGAYEVELHKRFEEYRTRGEWFDLRPLGDPVQVVTDAVNEIIAEV